MPRSTPSRLPITLLFLTSSLWASGMPRAQTPETTWTEYAYRDAGFSAQYPAAPVLASGVYGAQRAPARTWSARANGVDYSVTVADFTGRGSDSPALIDEAAGDLRRTGTVKTDVRERIDRQFGRELTLVTPGGASVSAAVFFVEGRLYILTGKADAAEGAARTVRFQQSLQFIDADGKPPRRPEDGPGFGPRGPGGPGGRRGPPPAAFAACLGKAVDVTVSFKTPRGVIEGKCVAAPDGRMVARPLMPPSDRPPEGPPV